MRQTHEKPSGRFSIRLTTSDQAALTELCDRYGLDRPNAVRRALRAALTSQPSLPHSGHFMACGSTQSIPIRFKRKAAHG